MMAQKAALFGDWRTQRKIMQTSRPHQQKALGRQIRPFDEEIWNDNRMKIVLRGNQNKFGQNEALGETLHSTGYRRLAEANTSDVIWGIGLSVEHADAGCPSQWPGHNLLGNILMDVRKELRRNRFLAVRSQIELQAALVGPPTRELIGIEGESAWALIDTGSVVSAIDEVFLRNLCPQKMIHPLTEAYPDFKLYGASGSTVPIRGFVEMTVLLPNLKEEIVILMMVFADGCLSDDTPTLIGTNVIKEWKKLFQGPCSVGATSPAGYTPYVLPPSSSLGQGTTPSSSPARPTSDGGSNQDTGRVCQLQFNWEVPGLSELHVNRAKGLVKEFSDIFASDSTELGRTDIEEHTIQIDDPTPIKCAYRRIPPAKFDSVKDELQKMLEAGVIRHSYSPWCSPMAIVDKKDGTPRICIDYRKLNLRTKKDAKSLPRIDETLDHLAGAKYFTSLDLMSGYWQIEVSPESKELTAFTAGPLGFFEFNRMPFGLCNSGASFQRMIEKVLKPLLPHDCLVYVDDIVVFSKDVDTHLEKLKRVFEQLRAHGLRLKPSKCTFLAKEITFLGHNISEDGISKDIKKVEAIKVWEAPSSVHELRRFLGMTGYLRRYIKNYAILAQPLTEMLKGYSNKSKNSKRNKELENSKWKWTSLEDQAFRDLKLQIADHVTLAFADFSKPFRLTVDASREGLGAFLEQEYESKKWRPLAFASRKTSDQEKKYPTHKLEFLALKWAVVDKFKEYLCNQSFEVYTDNNPLTYIHTNEKLDATAQRWVANLADFKFSIKFKPGVNNYVADALSRKYDGDKDDANKWRAWEETVSNEFKHKEAIAVTTRARREAKPDSTVESADEGMTDEASESEIGPGSLDDRIPKYDWRNLQEQDVQIQTVLRELLSGGEITKAQQRAQKLFKCWKRLEVHNGLLYYVKDDGGKVLVIPTKFQYELTVKHHDFGHFGRQRTEKQIRERYFWTGIRNTVGEVCRRCERCQKRKGGVTGNKSPLSHMKKVTRPMQRISMDFLSVDIRRESKFKILTVVDEFTKYGFAFEVKSENAATMAKLLYNRVYSQFGIPHSVHTDQGKSFVSRVMRELSTKLGIQQTTSTTYRPQANGGCERLNATILDRIGTLDPGQKRKWHEQLPSLMMAYNSTTHESIGMSPFYAMFLRSPRIPVDCILNVPDADRDDGEVTPRTYAEQKVKEMRENHKRCGERTIERMARNKRAYDKKLRKQIPEITIGQRVLLKKMTPKNKVDDRWEYEVYIVVRQESAAIPVYLIESVDRAVVKRVHRDHLIPFLDSLEVESERQYAVRHIPAWTDVRSRSPIGDCKYGYDKRVNERVSLWLGDITKIKTEAIVNVTGPRLQSNGELGDAIHRRAGPKLRKACKKLQDCEVGQAVTTSAYELPCDQVIHTPRSPQSSAEMLRGSYTAVLKEARKSMTRTIAIPCICNGIRPKHTQEDAREALDVVRKELETRYKWERIIICVYSKKMYDLYLKVFPEYFPYKLDDDSSEEDSESDESDSEIDEVENSEDDVSATSDEELVLTDDESADDVPAPRALRNRNTLRKPERFRDEAWTK